MPKITVDSFPPSDGHKLRLFLNLGPDIRKKEEFHVPLLESFSKDRAAEKEVITNLTLSGDDAPAPGTEPVLFLARLEGKPAARAAAFLRNPGPNTESNPVCSLAFFEGVNDRRVFDALIKKITEWSQSRGLKRIVGPWDPSPAGKLGCLTNDPKTPPTVLLPHHPRYYWALFAGYGFSPQKDHLCYSITRDRLQESRTFNRLLDRGGRAPASSPGLAVRRIDLGQLDREVPLLLHLMKESSQDSWGLSSWTLPELQFLFSRHRKLIDPDLIRILEDEGEPVGCILSLPDSNPQRFEALKYHRPFQAIALYGKKGEIDRLRIFAFSLRRSHTNLPILGYLIRDFLAVALDKGFDTAEISPIPDSFENPKKLERLLEAKLYRTYRTYQLEITDR